jgi:hypothetical protein
VGRIVEYLEETGQLDNTIIMYCADNGASGEGSPDGSVNENKFFNAWPDDLEQNLAAIDDLGSPNTYNHYPTGWATAFSTPFKMFKRYTYQGGVCDPLVISWPAGIKAKGEVRNQYHHAVDIVPTILECCGVEFPDEVLGYSQTPLPGVSMAYSFEKADGPTTKKIQYYEMFGTRALWHEGWHVVSQRAPLMGATAADFVNDTWELYESDTDRAEAHDRAAEYPDKVRELVNLWYVEARKYDVLPLDNRSLAELVRVQPVAEIPPSGIYRYYPDTVEVPEFNAANIRGRSYKILARVEIEDADAQGVLLAQGCPVRWPRVVHQGAQALVRLQLHWHPTGTGTRFTRGGRDRRSCPWSRVHQGERRLPRRGDRHRHTACRRPGRCQGTLAHPIGALCTGRRGAEHRSGLRRLGQQGIHPPLHIHRRADSRGRDLHRR